MTFDGIKISFVVKLQMVSPDIFKPHAYTVKALILDHAVILVFSNGRRGKDSFRKKCAVVPPYEQGGSQEGYFPLLPAGHIHKCGIKIL